MLKFKAGKKSYCAFVHRLLLLEGLPPTTSLPKDTTARPWHVLPFSPNKSMSLPPTSTSPIDTPKSFLKLQTPAQTKQSQPPLPPTSSIPAITPTRDLRTTLVPRGLTVSSDDDNIVPFCPVTPISIVNELNARIRKRQPAAGLGSTDSIGDESSSGSDLSDLD
ncbi:unnamed protein product [Orchesella dallaii]|uniref:Uncharacterized protein n=1 Tax=Orchesella dallaii TaxID=48710 RepID=A0ABP1R4N7_9HEXA